MPSETQPTDEVVFSSPSETPIVIADAVPEAVMNLDDFCVHFATLAPVETMGAFRFTERTAGRLVDLPSAYQARLDRFQHLQF